MHINKLLGGEGLRRYLGSLPRCKAPGPDGLPYELIRHPSSSFLGVLLAGINEAITSRREWPAVWKGGDIRLLYKKDSPLVISNYRPVVLLSATYKVITSTITSRLSAVAERYGFLDDSQEGFRPCKSTARQAQSLF